MSVKITQGKFSGLMRLSNSKGVIAAAAMDQRGSLQKSIAKARGVDSKEISREQMEEFKVAVSKVLTPHATAILLDPEFGLSAAKARAKNESAFKGLTIPESHFLKPAFPFCFQVLLLPNAQTAIRTLRFQYPAVS